MGPFFIDRFERVSSHFIHLGQNSSGPIQGSVTFDHNIVGVICIGDSIVLGSSLDESDFLSAGTIYPDGQMDRGLEIGPSSDRLQISSDRRTLTFWLDASTSSDSIRVITSVPTPGSLALLGLASLGTARRRR
jgi:MYXO-CTERM domain-containing protein